MCNLYSMTRNQDAIRRLFKVTKDSAGNLPSSPSIFPNNLAPVAFKASWDAFWPTLSEADIAEWRRVQAFVPSWERRRNKS